MLTFIIIAAAAIFLGLTLLLAMAWREVVPTNRVDIVQSAKRTTSYGHKTEIEDDEGNTKILDFRGNVYYKIPSSIPKFGVSVIPLPLSNFDINLNSYSAYDKDRLPFEVDVTGFFRISDPEVAARRISNFQELQNHLNEILKGTVRRVLAINHLENIMEDRAGLGETFTNEVKEQLREWGVTTVKMVEFMDLRDSGDSKVISNIMAKQKSRIEKESRVEVSENMKLAETAEIENKKEVDTSRIYAEQMVATKAAEKQQIVGIAEEKSYQEVQMERKISMEKAMLVKQVEETRSAEISRDVAVVKADENQKVTIITAEAEKNKQIIDAGGIKESDILRAEGKLQATIKEAEGVQALGSAEAEAERLKLHAPVSAQLTLAKEIGDNEGYQQYLIKVREVEKDEAVGKEMASALKEADMKVIANGGNVNEGVNNLAEMFSPKGGTQLSGFLAAISQTEEGRSLIEKFIKPQTK